MMKRNFLEIFETVSMANEVSGLLQSVKMPLWNIQVSHILLKEDMVILILAIS